MREASELFRRAGTAAATVPRGTPGRSLEQNAWGFTETGERVLLSVSLGMREAEQDWLGLGRDLTARGLRSPLLVVGDGAPGLISGVCQHWPDADRQRCTVHRVRNLLAKLPKRERERVRLAYWRALGEATDGADGRRRVGALIAELDRAGFAAAAACLADDLDALLVHLRYPLRHRRRWRSTNLLERSLGEVRRRTKVIGRFPGRRAACRCAGRCSTSSPPTPTASPSPTSTTRPPTGSRASEPSGRPERRCPPSPRRMAFPPPRGLRHGATAVDDVVCRQERDLRQSFTPALDRAP
jgi:hypothetical protein